MSTRENEAIKIFPTMIRPKSEALMSPSRPFAKLTINIFFESIISRKSIELLDWAMMGRT